MEEDIVETKLTGLSLLTDPFLNKGSAFSEAERREFNLCGLLPSHVSSLQEQMDRTYGNFRVKSSALEKYIFLASLQDRNETLFYRLVQKHIAEMVPILYTPTVGEACQRYSHIFRRARGIYLSYSEREQIPEILRCVREDISVIVVTDGERILGLGDLGVGGMGIPVGKLALYTLCAGIHPQKTLPVLLDVGTNNASLLEDPLYLGWRHPRVSREEYDAFIDQFVKAVQNRWPRVLLQWEDFAKGNAWRLLQHYRNQLASFNDDIQGTAAVTLAGLLRAVSEAGRRLEDERVVIAGAGSAATGIAGLLTRASFRSIWLVDSQGLVHQGRNDLSEEKKPFAKSLDQVRSAGMDSQKPIDLPTLIKHVKPTALAGTSGQPGTFTREMMERMASYVDRPIIFPLSNPTSKSEATPEQLFQWTQGKALIATGSPFAPVFWKDRRIPVGQCNNAFIFPGVGLGLVAAGARRVPDEVFLEAARTLARYSRRLPGDEESLFPNLEDVRTVSEEIAVAVGREVVRQGLSQTGITKEEVPQRVRETMWIPAYPRLKRIR